MKKILFVILICSCIGNSSVAQVVPEELSRLKRELAEAKHDSTRGRISFFIAVGYRFSNVDSSLFYADYSLGLARKLKNLTAQAYLLSLKGATLLESGRLPESLQFQFEALKIGEELNNADMKAFSLNRIGNTYMELGDYRKANEYYFLSKQLFESLNDTAMVDNELSNIGNIYELLGMPDSALYYQQMVYHASLKTSDRNAYVRPEIMFRMGNAYVLAGDNKRAMEYYKKGIAEAYFDNDIRNLTMNNLFLAKLYNQMNQYDSSMKYARTAIQTGNIISFRKGVYEASLLMSKLFESKGNYDSAYKYLLKANVEKDSLTGTKRFQELQRILLDEQQRLREMEIKGIASENRQRQFALFAGLGVFLIIALILYLNNRQKQRTNKILGETLANLKSTQSQLIQSEKMASLGELTAGIAHEIQNPLNFVNNFSEVNKELLEELKSELSQGSIENAKSIADNLVENENKIIHHGKRADSIVKGMLMHSRSSSGKKEPTDLNALASEYFRLAYHGLRAKDKSFNAIMKTNFDEKAGRINIVPEEIGRVILNLINNAFHAVAERKRLSPNGYEPTVTIATKMGNGMLELSVSDNGLGIPEKARDKIFQPFFTTKPAGEGTGLGLSLSYDIVKSHNGEIRVQTKEGEGTQFIIQLPG